METQTALPRPATFPPSVLTRILQRTTVFALTLVLLLSLLLLVRRVSGAAYEPVPGWTIVLTGIVGAASASIVRCASSRLFSVASRRARIAQLTVPTVCALSLALALSAPRASAAAVICLWSIFAIEEGYWWFRALRPPHARTGHPQRSPARSGPAPVDSDAEERPLSEAEELPANVTQQITRAQDETGIESVSGLLRYEFAPGERTANLHVAFCPPLDYEPAVNAYQIEGPPVTIKVGQAESFGIRLELRLTSKARRREGIVTFFETRPA